MRTLLFISSLLFLSPYCWSGDFDFIVDQSGNGDFRQVQEALNAVPEFRKKETRILIRDGAYYEKITLTSTKTNVTLIGESAEKVKLTYDDHAAKKNRFGEEMGTSSSSSFFIYGDNFKAENLTFQNSAGRKSQAVAVRVDGDKAIFINCRFLGFQDTLYPHGKRSRQYYKNCYIEGATDFIFGWSTAVFENCEIFSKEGGHYITAASTDKENPYGFVFVDCQLTGDAPEQSVFLGRPWRPFAKTVFISCSMGAHISAAGWHNWKKPEAEKTAYYAEYKSSGPGASNVDSRVKWSHQLNKNNVNDFSLEKVFNGWIPNTDSSLNF